MKAEYLIYFCNGIDSVYDSQVLELIKAINNKRSFKKVYLFMGLKNGLEKRQFQNKTIPAGIDVVFFKMYPNYPVFNIQLRRELRKSLKNNKLITAKAIYHTRHEILAWHLSKILGKKYYNNILPDIRGATIEEISEFGRMNRFYKYLKIYNYKKALNNLTKFKKISAVTETLKNYLVTKFKVNAANIFIIPCLAGKNFNFDIVKRNNIRESLNLKPEDVLLLYSTGGLESWHGNSVVKLLADKGMKLLNLSKKTIQHENVINKFVNYNEMPVYLNAVDASIIWREKSTVNEVASPVKFSEYVCSGLPVISNYNINIVSEYIKENAHGILLEDENQINSDNINKLRSLNRYEISAKGIGSFGIDNITQKYIELYSSF